MDEERTGLNDFQKFALGVFLILVLPIVILLDGIETGSFEVLLFGILVGLVIYTPLYLTYSLIF